MIFLYVLAQTLDLLISAMLLALFARSILSLMMFDIEDNRIAGFIYTVSDLITAPVRTVCDRMGWFQGIPIDMPHLITLLLLFVIQIFIPEVRL